MIDRRHVEKALARLTEIESRLSEPGTASNQKLYQQLVREHSALKKLSDKAQRFFDLMTTFEEHSALIKDESSDSELRELAQSEIGEIEEALPQAEKDLMFALLPPEPSEERNAIVEVRAGTGGDAAALFAGDLFRMYSRFAETQGWKINLISASASEVGGFKEIMFSVEGAHVYKVLQYESGGHRVQRIPVTESSGRIHTSAATVAVFPEVEAEDDITIPPDEVRIDIYRASGPGGQSVNTTDSAVRLTHIPTGVVVQCQDEKSQQRNREKAMKVLTARILDKRRQDEADAMGKKRRALIGSGDRSERIRTYNFPQNRLTDHRINMTLYSLDRAMEGALEDLTNVLREHDLQERVAQELKELATESEPS
jgi:peptide chain release factor 1